MARAHDWPVNATNFDVFCSDIAKNCGFGESAELLFFFFLWAARVSENASIDFKGFPARDVRIGENACHCS